MNDRDPDRAILARIAFAAFFYGFTGLLVVLGLTPVWSRWFR